MFQCLTFLRLDVAVIHIELLSVRFSDSNIVVINTNRMMHAQCLHQEPQ